MIKRQKAKDKRQKYFTGFTLVELLIVIAVVSVITAVLFPNFMGARERARDTVRKSDMKTIQDALELYKLDRNPPVYPTTDPATGTFTANLCGQCWSSDGIACTGNLYLRKFPCDPGSTNPTPYIYERSATDPLTYSLTACLENLIDTDRDPTPQPTCRASATSYTVHEP